MEGDVEELRIRSLAEKHIMYHTFWKLDVSSVAALQPWAFAFWASGLRALGLRDSYTSGCRVLGVKASLVKAFRLRDSLKTSTSKMTDDSDDYE